MDSSLSVSRKRTSQEDWDELSRLLGEDRGGGRLAASAEQDPPWKCQVSQRSASDRSVKIQSIRTIEEWRFLRPAAVPSSGEAGVSLGEEEERFWVPHPDEGFVISTLKETKGDSLILEVSRLWLFSSNLLMSDRFQDGARAEGGAGG